MPKLADGADPFAVAEVRTVGGPIRDGIARCVCLGDSVESVDDGKTGTGVAGGVGCGVGLTTMTRGNKVPEGGLGGGRRMVGIGATTIQASALAFETEYASKEVGIGLISSKGCLANDEETTSLSGIISAMIFPTDEPGFVRMCIGCTLENDDTECLSVADDASVRPLGKDNKAS